MPTVRTGEARGDFVERCIPIVIDDGTASDGSQGAAICNSMYDTYLEEKAAHLPEDDEDEDEDEDEAKQLLGLYLADPHGPLIWDGTKKAIAKSGEAALEGSWVLTGPGYPGAADPGKAYGIIEIGPAETVNLKTFDEQFDDHRVTKSERRKWWPEAEKLVVYPINEFEKWDPPQGVRIPEGVRDTIKKVEFTGDSAYIYRRPSKDTVLVKDFVGLGGSGADIDLLVAETPDHHSINDKLADTLPAPTDGSIGFPETNGQKSQPVADLVLRWKRGPLLAEEKAGLPINKFGLNAGQTLHAVDERGAKFSQPDANYRVPAENPREACGACRFFLRDPNGSPVGRCEVVDGPIAWFATSDYYIAAEDEAIASFAAMGAYVYEDEGEASDKAFIPKVNLGYDDEPMPGYLNIFPAEGDGVDLVWDVGVGLPLPTGSVVEVTVDKALQHLKPDKQLPLIGEVYRVLANGGLLRFDLSPETPKQPVQGELDEAGRLTLETFKAIGEYFEMLELDEPNLKGILRKLEPKTKEAAPPDFIMMVAPKQDKPSKPEGGVRLHAEDYASVGDANETSTWKLPLTKTPGGVDAGRIAAAITAMQPGGFRGNRVQLTAPKATVVKRIRAAINKLDDDDQKERLMDRLARVKSGRRMSRRRAGTLRKVRDELYGLLAKVSEIVGWADYEDKRPWVPFRSVKLYEDENGQKGMVVWTTNAFKDRDNEMFETKALEEYVKRHEDDNDKGSFWFWHIPGSKFGTIKAQGVVGRFLVEAGPFDDTPAGKAFEKFFDDFPDGHPAMSPEGWGASHGFVYDPKDRDDGVYKWFEKHESSVLPGSVAANPHNPSMEVFEMNEKQEAAFRSVVGDDLVDSLLETGDKLTETLEGQGIEHKERAPEAEAEAESEEVEPKAEKEEGPGNGDGEAEEGEAEPEAPAEGAKEFATVSQLEDVGESIKIMATQIGTLTDTMQAFVATEDERIDDKLENTPLASLKALTAERVMGSKKTKLRKDSKLAKAGPEEQEAETENSMGISVLDRLKAVNQAQRSGG